MPTRYKTEKRICYSDIFDGRLEELGIHEYSDLDEKTDKSRGLTDGRNYLWVYADDDGYLYDITRYGPNAPQKILSAISEAFDTVIYSEYEHQYWGFETKEQWDAFREKIRRESQDEFYLEILKYIRGESILYDPGTIGMLKARIAKRLVTERPELLEVSNRDELLKAIDEIYNRDQTVRTTFTSEQVAFAEMLATHEEDSPKA